MEHGFFLNDISNFLFAESVLSLQNRGGGMYGKVSFLCDMRC